MSVRAAPPRRLLHAVYERDSGPHEREEMHISLWLEQQTGVVWSTLRHHYLDALKAMATEGAHAATRLAAIAPASFAFTSRGRRRGS